MSGVAAASQPTGNPGSYRDPLTSFKRDIETVWTKESVLMMETLEWEDNNINNRFGICGMGRLADLQVNDPLWDKVAPSSTPEQRQGWIDAAKRCLDPANTQLLNQVNGGDGVFDPDEIRDYLNSVGSVGQYQGYGGSRDPNPAQSRIGKYFQQDVNDPFDPNGEPLAIGVSLKDAKNKAAIASAMAVAKACRTGVPLSKVQLVVSTATERYTAILTDFWAKISDFVSKNVVDVTNAKTEVDASSTDDKEVKNSPAMISALEIGALLAQSGAVGESGITPDQIFDSESLKKFRDGWNEFCHLFQKIARGEHLSLDERKVLSTMLANLENVLQTLNATFASELGLPEGTVSIKPTDISNYTKALQDLNASTKNKFATLLPQSVINVPN